jgi:hypothetical protein
MMCNLRTRCLRLGNLGCKAFKSYGFVYVEIKGLTMTLHVIGVDNSGNPEKLLSCSVVKSTPEAPPMPITCMTPNGIAPLLPQDQVSG